MLPMKTNIAILCLLTFPAAAQEAYSIPWFTQHADARKEALRMCRDDHRLTAGRNSGPICANAEKAETRLYANQQALSLRDLDSPLWWSQNTALRQSTLTACGRRAAYDRPMLRYCDPARKSVGM